MINQSDIIAHDVVWFDGDKYLTMQKKLIMERIARFPGSLYLEIGGKFLIDQHASRVLPWFYPDMKKRIFNELLDQATIVFCINADDIVGNRQLSNEDISYELYVQQMIEDIVTELGQKPLLVVNLVDDANVSVVDAFIAWREKKEYIVYKRYKIINYLNELEKVVSPDGFGRDEYIKTDKKLVLVTWAASNSGKMSTCLGQVYLDNVRGIDSGYAKYETFPIWNLPLRHPVNLAYEAATADIDDYNCIDSHHLQAYGQEVVNYNRDVEAFPILLTLIKKIVGPDSYMHNYQSPTDMGLSSWGFCIRDSKVVRQACYDEILRRRERYKQMMERGEGQQKRIDACDDLACLCRTIG